MAKSIKSRQPAAKNQKPDSDGPNRKEYEAELTKPLTGPQWLACIALALPLALVVEISKWIRRRRTSQPTIDARQAVSPAHARNERIGVAVK